MPQTLSMPSTLVGPKWDSTKNKWKWILTADYSEVTNPPYTYNMDVTASVGENAMEPRYALLPCPPTPYTIWVSPITSGSAASYVGGLSANVENSRGDVYRTDEYDLVPPCMLVELDRIFHYNEGLWSITVTASLFEGVAPFIYTWSSEGATGGGRTTDNFIRFELDRAKSISVSVKVVDASGCLASGSVTVIPDEMKNLVPPDWSYEDEICGDGVV